MAEFCPVDLFLSERWISREYHESLLREFHRCKQWIIAKFSEKTNCEKYNSHNEMMLPYGQDYPVSNL